MSLDVEQDVVQLLKQYRHDWLNKIQLIKGNLELGRIDKVEKLINEVILQSKNESNLSNLKMKRVASRLLTFNWGSHPYLLSYEIIGGEEDWSLKEDTIEKILAETFSLLDTSATLGEENELLIIFHDVDGYKLEIDFHGKINNKEVFKEKIMGVEALLNKNIVQIEWSENGYFMAVDLND